MTFWESLVYAMFHVMVIVMITGLVFAFIRDMRADRRLERQERIRRTRHNIYMLERELGLVDPSEDTSALKPGQNVTAHK